MDDAAAERDAMKIASRVRAQVIALPLNAFDADVPDLFLLLLLRR